MRKETTISKDIELYRKLINEQKEEISKRETIIDSLMESMVKKVRQITLPYSDKMMYGASCGQKSATNADPKNINMYNFVTGDIIERLFKKEERKEVEFKSISGYGYDSHAYGFYFKYKNILFELKIPNVQHANKDNLYDMDYGKYQLFYEKSHRFYDFIENSYDLDDIAKAIQDFVNETWYNDELF